MNAKKMKRSSGRLLTLPVGSACPIVSPVVGLLTRDIEVELEEVGDVLYPLVIDDGDATELLARPVKVGLAVGSSLTVEVTDTTVVVM